MQIELTTEALRTVVSYDAETGVFRWLADRPGGVKAGSIAGCASGDGYWRIGVFGGNYKAHRLAFLYVTGRWPADQIDHIDGDRRNNRFSNLREAHNSQNAKNARIHCDNLSGFKGVERRPRVDGDKWGARICVDGRRITLGLFATPEEAHAAYMEGARRYHGEFASAGGG